MLETKTVVERRGGDRWHGRSVTYQLLLIQCGKPRCKRWHGPYWYAKWKAAGRTRVRYIGKKWRSLAQVEREKLSRQHAGQRKKKGA